MAQDRDDGRLDNLIDAAVSASCDLIELRDEGGDPSYAFAFLSSGVRDLAVQRTPRAALDCAKRFETVATWLAPIDPNRAVRMSTVAGGLRDFTTPY